MNEQLKAGDTVRLKSGGPLMTVESIDEYIDGKTKAKCTWFIDSKKNDDLFVLSALIIDED